VTSHIARVTVSAGVAAPADEVFAFVADTRNDPLWCPNVTDAVLTSGDGVAVGSRFRFHQAVSAGGRHFESDVDVEVLELGERTITWRVEDRFQQRTVSLTVEPDGDGSRVTQRTEAEFKRKPDLLTRLGYPLLAKRTFRDQFRHLEARFT
jgi:hypothetical protein